MYQGTILSESGEPMANDFLYNRIYSQLRQQIESGQLPAGSRLETEMELRQRYDVSRETVRRALAMLESEGYIVRKVSAGTFVRAKKAQYAPSSYHESFTEQMHRQGKRPSSQIRSIEILNEPSTQIRRALQLEENERVYCVRRVRMADDVPMAYEIAYIRQSLCPNLQTLLLDESSLYCIYEDHYHLNMDSIKLKIEAITADAQLQKILSLKESLAVLKITSLMYLEDGTPLYYVVCYHAGSKYEFTTTMPRKP